VTRAGVAVLAAHRSTEASFPLAEEDAYVRCRVTYRWRVGEQWLRCHAWGQPVFLDDRPRPPRR